MRKVLVIGAIAVSLLFWIPMSAFASVRLVPSKIELEVRPGEVASFTVELQNGGTTAFSVTASAWDFARDAKGTPQPVSASEALSFRGCAAWLGLPFSPIPALAGGDGAVPISLAVPADAAPGSHYTYVTVLASPKDADDGTTRIAYSFNVLVVLTVVPPQGGAVAGVPGDTATFNRAVSVTGVTAPSTLGSRVPMEAVLENTGNVHADVKTRFDLVSGGKVVDTVPAKEFTLLPGDRYPLEAVWTGAPLVGNYTVRFVAEIEGEKPLVGESEFWVVSWTAIYLALGMLAVLGIVTVTFRRFVHIEIRRADAKPVAN
jgi:hypothetical protein